MERRAFLKLSSAALFVGLGGCSLIPPLPDRPEADGAAALGWVSYDQSAYVLYLPRIEMGQGVEIALRQIACAELGIDFTALAVRYQDTDEINSVRSTVGSESIMLFALPLAQACATLRDAVASGRGGGELTVVPRDRSDLRAFRTGGLIGAAPLSDGHRSVVRGEPLYAADMRLPGMLYGRVLRAADGMAADVEPAGWNRIAAGAVPGFVAVVEHDGLRRGVNTGLGIVAETPGALDRIADALAVQWRVISPPPSGEFEVPEDPDYELRGDGAGEDGPWDVDIRLDIAPAAHNAMEPRAAVAAPMGRGLEIWVGSQDLFLSRNTVAHVLGLAEEDVRARAMRIGGGFGGRAVATVEVEAAILARAVGRPVKVQWTREQELSHAFHRPASKHRLRVGLDPSGLARWKHEFATGHVIFTPAALPKWMQAMTDLVVGDKGSARGAVPPYRITWADIGYDLIDLPYHTGPWRGLGAGPNGLAVESAMDAAAHAAGQDPLAFRLAAVDDPRLSAVLQRVAALSNWRAGAKATEGAEERIGLGIACGIYKQASYAALVAEVGVSRDGTVRVRRAWCAHDCGFIVNPDQVKAQCEGNLVWGLGLVLSDHYMPGDESFAGAGVPGHADMPEISIALVGSDAAPTGAGETVMAAAPGAVANAVFAATGVRPTRFPLQPEPFQWE